MKLEHGCIIQCLEGDISKYALPETGAWMYNPVQCLEEDRSKTALPETGTWMNNPVLGSPLTNAFFHYLSHFINDDYVQ